MSKHMEEKEFLNKNGKKRGKSVQFRFIINLNMLSNFHYLPTTHNHLYKCNNTSVKQHREEWEGVKKTLL